MRDFVTHAVAHYRRGEERLPVVHTELSRRHILKAAPLLAALAWAGPIHAQSGPSILRIIDHTGAVIEIDEDRIKAMPWAEYSTHTAFTAGKQEFRGPLMRDLLASVGISRAHLEGRSIKLTALNDFSIQFPVNDAWKYDVMIAREMNGKPLRLRDKGPLWLVYPRDLFTELQRAAVDERWVWQLQEIAIL